MEPEEAVKEARKVIDARFRGEEYVPEAEGKAGIFVTLKKGEELRGCIGFPLPRELPGCLCEAALAATRDPRFPPLREEEMGEVTVEVSFLSPPEQVDGPGEIEIGEHGVMLRLGHRSGLLLPQVAVEQGWDAEEFLDHCCLKAGVPPGSWKRPEAKIYRFRGVVCCEEEPCGRVVRRKLDAE